MVFCFYVVQVLLDKQHHSVASDVKKNLLKILEVVVLWNGGAVLVRRSTSLSA